MNIGGLQKLTLLDYPEHTACTVFLNGCNFRCPFCYNSSLLSLKQESNQIPEEEFFSFLATRKNKLDGVAISGGEPLLQKDIISFIQKIKKMGFLVKLDTNGSFPELLQYLIHHHLVDYVAMDIKNSFEKYNMTAQCLCDLEKIKKSIHLLLENKVDYEFRTTIVKEFHEITDFDHIGKMIYGAKRYYLQCFQNKESVLTPSLHALEKEDLIKCLKVVQKYIPQVQLRGMNI